VLNLATKAGNIGADVAAVTATGLSIWDNHAHYTSKSAWGRTVVDVFGVDEGFVISRLSNGAKDKWFNERKRY
jgi:hypothetical protein